MKTKTLLSFGEKFFKSLKILILLFSIFLVGLFFHSLIFPNSCDKILVSIQNGYKLNYNNGAPTPPNTFAEYNAGNNKLIYYSKLDVYSKSVILIHNLIPLFLFFYILKNLVFFFNSVKDYSTFFINNSRHFKIIAILLAVIYIFSLASNIISKDVSMAFPDGGVRNINSVFHFSLPELAIFTSLILLSFISSLVFKEGENLRVENQLTI